MPWKCKACQVVIVDENEVEDQLLQDRISAPITKMAVDPKARFLACYRRDGILTVMSTDFTSKVSQSIILHISWNNFIFGIFVVQVLDFDTKSMSRPMDITWVGDDSIAMVWKNTGIVMVGPYGDWLNFPYDGPVHLVSEHDCCRIVTCSGCEMLQRVPASTEAIRRIGSTDPAALLYDAMEAFEEGDPKSDENIRSIAATNQLGNAVKACLTAAAAEFDISRQQSLLKAASYGKAFCTDIDPSLFVETARKLRVLNSIRGPAVGLPLTVQQYDVLSPEVVVGRLTVRNQHFLAIRVCETLKLNNERILAHWATEKVKRMSLTDATDEQISRAIRAKVEAYGKLSYLEIARAAYNMGRRSLATTILDLEHHAADQVPLLLSMQEEEQALKKAIRSEDTELIYLAVLHLEKVRADTDSFYKLIHQYPEAANLLKMYYRSRVTASDRSSIEGLLQYSKNFLEAGMAVVTQAYLQSQIASRLTVLQDASKKFAQGKDLGFFKAATDDQCELLDAQKALEIKTGRDFVDLSLSATLSNLVLLCISSPDDTWKWENEIAKLVKRFKVSDKMLWNIRIHCYSKASQWQLFAKLASEKKSPVGYIPFARACIRYAMLHDDLAPFLM